MYATRNKYTANDNGDVMYVDKVRQFALAVLNNDVILQFAFQKNPGMFLDALQLTAGTGGVPIDYAISELYAVGDDNPIVAVKVSNAVVGAPAYLPYLFIQGAGI